MSTTAPVNPWRARLAIVAIGLAVRLIVSNISPPSTQYDASEYLSLAYHLRHSSVFSFGEAHKWGADGHFPTSGPALPTAARAPLYPAFIAALWNSGAPPLKTIQFTQALMGALTALQVFEIGLSVFGPATATLAGLAFCFAPLSIEIGTQILSESLFVLLTAAAIYLWILKRFTLAGLAFGLAILTRAVLLPAIPLMLAFLIFHRKKQQLIMPVIALIVVAPWTIRNVVLMHKPILVNTEGWGSGLLQGSLRVPYGSGQPFVLYGNDPPARNAIDSTPDESAAEQKMFVAAAARILHHPGQWLVTRIVQYPRLFLDPGTGIMDLLGNVRANQTIKIVSVAGNLLVTLLAAAGAWIARKRRNALPVILLPAFLCVINFPVISQPRYSLPMMPEMILLAAFVIVLTFRRLRLSPPSPRPLLDLVYNTLL